MLIVSLQTAQKPFQYGLPLSFPQDLGVDVTRGAVEGRFFRPSAALEQKGIRGGVLSNVLIYNALLKQVGKYCRPVLVSG